MGFQVFRQLFSPSEVAELEAAFMRVMDAAAAETGYDGARSLHIYPVTDLNQLPNGKVALSKGKPRYACPT